MDKELSFEIPKWGMRLLTALAASLSLGFFYAGLGYQAWAGSAPTWFEYFFYLIALVAAASSWRLLSWKQFVFFKANDQGMLFPCPKLKECDSDYLFVPWSRIRNIRIEEFFRASVGTTKGLAIDLQISLEERNQYFPGLLLKEHKEWTTVGFTDAFLDKGKAVERLRLKKAQAAPQPHRH